MFWTLISQKNVIFGDLARLEYFDFAKKTPTISDISPNSNVYNLKNIIFWYFCIAVGCSSSKFNI